MSEDANLSLEKQALLALRKMRTRVQELERQQSEPIAVVGLGCRFPGGAVGPDSYWAVLRDGIDAISEVPRDRWDIDAYYDPDPDAPGKMYTRLGGFLEAVDRFDNAFFGLAPREVATMDPQQRLLLEVAWEALEHAGQPPHQLRDEEVGVFIGISGNDYGQQLRSGEAGLDAYFGTGNALNAAAGRLSYVFGFQGPCMAVDTACSSSLVAVHLACQSLRGGECRLALAGGVNVILSPDVTINFSRARMMAPDGHCKTFDEAADGYVRGEGCGVVVLKRLSDAVEAGDRILAVIRGSAVNQDGRSSGFTAPNELAQEALIRKALKSARVTPAQVSYVEAHGTGTSLGDPIELQALAAALREGRGPDRALTVGSAKTNIGHLEAAAGIAGVIKVVLALEHKEIPPHLNFKTLNPRVELDGFPLTIPTTRREWTSDAPRIAGVSSFGFSGTNAHIVLEEAPQAEQPASSVPERPAHLIALSARSDTALQAVAGRYARHLSEHASELLPDVCFTANTGRSAFEHRAAFVAQSAGDLQRRLAAFAGGRADVATSAHVTEGGVEPDVAWLFTGQGSQYPGMGQRLFDTQPTFRRALETCDEILRPLLAHPLLSVIYGEHSSKLGETAFTQPSLFSLEYALAQLWRAWGVKPAAVMGHSIGEYVAACVAGVMSLEDALKLVAARGRLMQALPRDGAMAAVLGDHARVSRAVAAEASVSIAAANGPSNTVISGSRTGVEAVVARLKREGIDSQLLAVSHAFHSSLMDPMLDEFERIASDVTYHEPRLGVVSNLTGKLIDHDTRIDAGYWRKHAREAVLFGAGMAALHARGLRLFLEVGPSPTLLGMGRHVVTDGDAIWLPSLRRGVDDWTPMLDTLSALYVRGADVDFAAFDRDYSRKKVVLPTYPFERERHWIAPPDRSIGGDVAREVQGLLYDLQWRAQPLQERAAGPVDDVEHLNRRWVVLADSGGIGRALASRLEARGDRATVVEAASCDPGSVDDFKRILGDAAVSGELTGIVHLWNLDVVEPSPNDARGVESQTLLGCGSVLHLVQAIAQQRLSHPPQLWLATRGAQSTAPEDKVAAFQSPVWGMARTIAVEHPELHCTRIDLDGAAGSEDLLAREIVAASGEDQVAFRGGKRFVARLVRRQPAVASTESLPVRTDGSYLITGGFGGVGLQLAHWLVDRGARHVVLASRRGATPESRAEVDALESAGARVLSIAADLSRADDVSRVLETIPSTWPPLRGVVHAAGVLDDGVMLQQNWARVRQVMSPKIDGAWRLHTLTRDLPLDFFITCSSAAALVGTAGQCSYAASNAFLDGLAHARRANGLAALSVNWGPWAEAGMAARTGGQSGRWAAQGLGLLAPRRALAALDQLLREGASQAVVLSMDWPRSLAAMAGSEPALLQEIAAAEGGGHGRTSKPAAAPALIAELRKAPAAKRQSLLLGYVRDQAREVLGVDLSASLDTKRGFQDMGLDSLMALDLTGRLKRALDRQLPATIVFDYPTVESLTAYLHEQIESESTASVEARSSAAGRQAVVSQNEPIAIIGVGCRFPGGATTPEAFWQLLRNGVDAVGEVPRGRWDIDQFFDPDPDAPGKMYVRRAAFLEDVEGFDPQFFSIAPREALSMDPQQRLLLEVSWEALERAGQAPDRLAGSQTGVFVGISGSDYGALQGAGGGLEALDAYFGTGNSLSAAAGRLSYVLGLRGPSLAIDTACSSSLVAVHLAAQSLRAGECRMAIAGGVNLMLSPAPFVVLSRARMLAPDGRCKTFDDSADGYVRGEGCGMVVLKRLSDAMADRDEILAVVHGTAVNQDGRSGGLTVPNGPAQQALVAQALAASPIDAADIAYVEAHGTGTSLGDPIEIRALAGALGDGREADRPLLVGSVKTNIGHLEAAAGVAGLIKVVLSMQHGEIPPHLNFQTPNSHIPWSELPVRVARQVSPWPAGRRAAGVSSFGFAGTNAHLILERAPEDARPADSKEQPAMLVTLSARNEEALRMLASSWAGHLEQVSPCPALADVAFAANAGRPHFGHRVGIIATSIEELRDTLRAVGNGERPAAAAFGAPQSGSRPEILMDFGSVMQATAAGKWQAWGVVPDAVTGQGVGLVAAAVHAGAIGLQAGLELAAEKSLDIEHLRQHAAWTEPRIPIVDDATELESAQPVIVKLDDGVEATMSNVRDLYLAGVDIDWVAFEGERHTRKVTLPASPFQRTRFWLEGARIPSSSAPMSSAAGIYHLEWRPSPIDTKTLSAPEAGAWMLLADRGGIATAIAEELRGRGSEAVLVDEPLTRAGAVRAVGEVSARLGRCLGIVSARHLDRAPARHRVSTEDLDASRAACADVLTLFQSLANQESTAAPKVWLLTRGAQSVLDSAVDVAHAPLWGLGRGLALESPASWGGLIDLDPERGVDAPAIVDALVAGDGEDQMALRGGQRLVPRLVRTNDGEKPAEIHGDGAYLVTGGLGALGLRLARWLVDRGARHLILLGRRGASDDVRADLERLEVSGVRVDVVSADVADQCDMQQIFDGLRGAGTRLRGVLHAAGVVNPAAVGDLTTGHLEDVFRAKVAGTSVLDALTSGLSLDFFVMFSSASAVLGSRRLTHYGAANHFQDAIAHERRARRLPALSINWGPWGGGGMTSADGEASFSAIGMKPIDPDRALRLLGQLIASGRTQATVVDVDWSVFAPIFTARARRRLLDEVTPASTARQDEQEEAALLKHLRAAMPGDREDILIAHVRGEVTRILGFDLLDADAGSQGFFQLGMDSLMAVDLRRRLEAGIQRPLPPTLAFDFPSVAAIVGYLRREVLSAEFDGHDDDRSALEESPADDPFSMVEQLSDEEVDRLFAEKMLNQSH